jgi:hypothetical protein
MNCNYDCDESPSLSSNDCLIKDVTVLICSGVDGLSIFVIFSTWFNSRKFEYIFWMYWQKMFKLLVFLLHSKTKWNSSSKTLQIEHSLWSLGILRYLPISKTIYLKHVMSADPLRGGRCQRGGAPGSMRLGGPQAKREKNRGCTLCKANKIKCVLSWICEGQFSVVDIKFFIQK